MYIALAFFIVCVLFADRDMARIPLKRFIDTVVEPVTLASLPQLRGHLAQRD